MAIYDGSLLRLKIDGSTVYHSTEASISMSRDFKERSTKDTEGTEIAPGIKSWSASCSALGVQELPAGVTTALAFEQLFDKYDADTVLDVEFSLDATGTTFYKGTCFIESLELNAPNEEDATASISLRGSGIVEKATVA
jgi:predicted secreted protein